MSSEKKKTVPLNLDENRADDVDDFSGITYQQYADIKEAIAKVKAAFIKATDNDHFKKVAK